MRIEKILLTVSDVASLLGCCDQVIYKKIAKGELAAFKTGGVWKIYAQSVSDYVAAKLKDKTCV